VEAATLVSDSEAAKDADIGARPFAASITLWKIKKAASAAAPGTPLISAVHVCVNECGGGGIGCRKRGGELWAAALQARIPGIHGDCMLRICHLSRSMPAAPDH
jgi:hypothetical protein